MSYYDFDIKTISSNFFKPSYVTDYKTALGDLLQNNKMTFLNLEQLRDYLSYKDITSYSKNIEIFKEKFVKQICTDINPRHITILINKILLSHNIFQDMLILANIDYMKDAEESIEKRLQNFHGFIIVKKEDYDRKQPSLKFFMVKLICSRIIGGGSLLLGAYLYIVKLHTDIIQYGLLELFRGYENIKGFCAYSKFGFVPKLDYKHARFSDIIVELPMSINIENITFDDIIYVVNGRKNIIQIDFDRVKNDPIYENLVYNPLCSKEYFENISSPPILQKTYIPIDKQAELAILYNKLYVAYYTGNKTKIQSILDEITTLRIQNAQSWPRVAPINHHDVGDLYVQRCKTLKQQYTKKNKSATISRRRGRSAPPVIMRNRSMKRKSKENIQKSKSIPYKINTI